MNIKKLLIRAGIVIGALALVSFVAIQFVPVEQTNPPVVHEPNWDSPETRALAKRACFDCHSNETTWPWYSSVAPVSWAVADHVHEGREELNFSEWSAHESSEEIGENDESEEAGEEMAEEVKEMVGKIRKGKMPLPSYLLLHPEARLTDAEIEQLVQGIEATFGSPAKAAFNR